MKRIVYFGVVVMAILAFSAVTAMAQSERLPQPMRIAAIKANVPGFLNERVRIDGFVTQFVDSGAKSTSFYYLKDDWGSVVKVRTSKQSPSVGKRYSIEGPVGIDPRSKDLYISEESRVELFKGVEPWINMEQVQIVSPPTATAPEAATATQPEAIPVTSSKATVNTTTTSPNTSTTTTATTSGITSRLLYITVGGAALIILAIVLFLVFRPHSDEMATTDFAMAATAAAEPPPPPEQVIEGRTIKLHAPPPNTVKLLPGWFEVVSGDEVVKQIRFYKLGGDRGSETTFGRASGRPYAHIQLKAPTVSSRQAKVSFDNGAPSLTNFASSDSNPTKVNGRDLAVNESVSLKESDRVEMGEVSLLFHELGTSQTVVSA
jgi:hypothetical protein